MSQDTENIDSQNDAGQGTDENLDESNQGSAANAGTGNDDSSHQVEDADIDNITDVDELRSMLKTTNSSNKKLYNRVQDAKGLKFDKATKKWVPKAKATESKKVESNSEDSLSTDDVFVLVEAKIPKDDIQEVRDYAKLKNISISEALNAPTLKSILSDRAEERNTANATSTGPTRRGSTKSSTTENLKKAEQNGEIPEDDDEIGDLVEARLNKRLGKK